MRQVLIESRIVIADDNFNRDLGVRFGVSYAWNINGGNRATGNVGGGLGGNTNFGGVIGTGDSLSSSGNQNLLVDLPFGNPASAIKFAVVSIPDFILQLELQALQLEGRGEVISNPARGDRQSERGDHRAGHGDPLSGSFLERRDLYLFQEGRAEPQGNTTDHPR